MYQYMFVCLFFAKIYIEMGSTLNRGQRISRELAEPCLFLSAETRRLRPYVATAPISRINYWSKLWVPSHFPLISADHKSPPIPLSPGNTERTPLLEKHLEQTQVRWKGEDSFNGSSSTTPSAAPERMCLSVCFSLWGCVGGIHLEATLRSVALHT